jgi:hypothetical protein
MFAMFALSALVAPLGVPRPQAKAFVRIARPAIANKGEWERLPASRRKERIQYDEQGRPVLVRLVEYE